MSEKSWKKAKKKAEKVSGIKKKQLDKHSELETG